MISLGIYMWYLTDLLYQLPFWLVHQSNLSSRPIKYLAKLPMKRYTIGPNTIESISVRFRYQMSIIQRPVKVNGECNAKPLQMMLILKLIDFVAKVFQPIHHIKAVISNFDTFKTELNALSMLYMHKWSSWFEPVSNFIAYMHYGNIVA